MNNKPYTVAPIVTLLFFLAGCQIPEKKPQVAMDTFAEVYADLVRLNYGADSLAIAQRADSLLKEKGIDRKLLEKTIAAYEHDPKRWAEFYEKVVKRLDTETRRQTKADSSAK